MVREPTGSAGEHVAVLGAVGLDGFADEVAGEGVQLIVGALSSLLASVVRVLPVASW